MFTVMCVYCRIIISLFLLITEFHIHSLNTIGYTLLLPCWTVSSSWHQFIKEMKIFLWDFGPYWHNIIRLLQFCWLHIHANLPFHHIPKVLCWICWLWRLFECSELIVIFRKPVTSVTSFILLESSIRRCVHCGHKDMKMVCTNTQEGCRV